MQKSLQITDRIFLLPFAVLTAQLSDLQYRKQSKGLILPQKKFALSVSDKEQPFIVRDAFSL